MSAAPRAIAAGVIATALVSGGYVLYKVVQRREV